jgi:hypothetical protein
VAFKVINNSISQSRLYRATQGFSTLTGEAVSELLFAHTLALVVALQDWSTAAAATRYALHTGRNQNFTLFRTTSTDLYALAYMVDNPGSNRNNLRNRSVSTAHLRSLTFDGQYYAKMLFRLGNSNVGVNELTTFLYRLQIQLNISGELVAARRAVTNWHQETDGARRIALTRIRRAMLQRAGTPNQDLLLMVNKMLRNDRFRYRSLRVRPSMPGRLAAPVAGAAAGAAAAGAVDDKYQAAGAGLGAIAGYWASRRRR